MYESFTFNRITIYFPKKMCDILRVNQLACPSNTGGKKHLNPMTVE